MKLIAAFRKFAKALKNGSKHVVLTVQFLVARYRSCKAVVQDENGSKHVVLTVQFLVARYRSCKAVVQDEND
jgi:hypothetical protein